MVIMDINFENKNRGLKLDPTAPAFYQNPYETYAFLHQKSPIFYWEDYQIWCFGDFQDVNNLLRDKRFGRENKWGAPLNNVAGRNHLSDFDRLESGSLLEREAPAHTRLRILVNRAFVSRSVERLKPRIETIANDLIDQFPTSEPFDLLTHFATSIPVVIICELLGVPAQEADRLLNWSHAMCEMYLPSRSMESGQRANQASLEFSEFLKNHIKTHRGRGTDDLLSALISVRDTGEKLSDDELISTCVLLLNAGHEATVHQTGNAVKTLLENHQSPLELFNTAEQTAATVEECLRFDAPLHMFTRYANEDVKLDGAGMIKAGGSIGLLLGMANRDPKAFEQPDSFNPTRPDQKNVSFGAGIHFCVGAPLARLELQTSLKTLFQRIPSLKLADNPSYRNSFHFHGLESLMVTTG